MCGWKQISIKRFVSSVLLFIQRMILNCLKLLGVWTDQNQLLFFYIWVSKQRNAPPPPPPTPPQPKQLNMERYDRGARSPHLQPTKHVSLYRNGLSYMAYRDGYLYLLDSFVKFESFLNSNSFNSFKFPWGVNLNIITVSQTQQSWLTAIKLYGYYALKKIQYTYLFGPCTYS